MTNSSAAKKENDGEHTQLNKGRFRKGSSGNSNGRPKGSRNRQTVEIEQLLDRNEVGVLLKILEKARDGHHPSALLCVKHLFQPKRARPVPLDLPKIETLADAVKASNGALQAAASGELTLEDAEKYMGLISRHAKVLGYSELEARVQALEGKSQSGSSEEQ